MMSLGIPFHLRAAFTSWDWSIPQVSWQCTSNWPSPFPQRDKDVGVHEIQIQIHVSNKEVFYNTIHTRFYIKVFSSLDAVTL